MRTTRGTRAAGLTSALLTCLLVASCGSGASGGDDGGEQPAEAVDEASALACTGEGDAQWRATVAAAEEEGRVVLYSTLLPEINTRLEAAFEEVYPGIDLEITRTVGPEISSILDAEKQTGTDGADVVSHVNYSWMYDHVDDGYFVEPAGPHSAGPQYAGTDNLKEGVFAVSLLSGIGIAWRTDLVPEPPTSYEDLLDPRFGGGQLGIVDAQGNPSTSSFYAWAQDEFGDDFVSRLAAQDPKVYPTAVPTLEALIAGEVSINAWASSVGVAQAEANGAPIDFVLPDPGFAPLNLSYMLSWSQRPNASQVLFDFMACPAGQEALARDNVSVLPDVPGTLGPPDSVTPANLERMLDPAWTTAYSDSWVEAMGR